MAIIEIAARPGDLLIYPTTISAVASAAAMRAGIAHSYSKTVWNVGVVTRVSREGVAIAHRIYSRDGHPGEGAGAVSGQFVGSAAKCAPLTPDDLARRFAEADFASVIDARDAIKAAIDAAKRGDA